MTPPRRGFLALFGGALLSGGVQRSVSAETPTLILPSSLVSAPPARPLLAALLAGGRSQMQAIIAIGRRLPKERFLDWLEDGLQRSLLFPAPDDEADQRRLTAAVANHGSMVAAIQAGAL